MRSISDHASKDSRLGMRAAVFFTTVFLMAILLVVAFQATPPASLENLRGPSTRILPEHQVLSSNQTVIGGHPAYLPTYNFTVQGILTTKSGVPLPDAPVEITFLNHRYNVSTNSKGIFQNVLLVPSNATDGAYNVYAAFSSNGKFGPSVNFTTIEVYHESMDVVLRTSAWSVSGLPAKLWGNVKANGTNLPNAEVSLSLPWGSFVAKSNASGDFAISYPVPANAFSFTAPATLNLTANEAYVAPFHTSRSLQLLNPLLIAAPTIALAIVLFEARNLGVFGRLRTGSNLSLEPKEIERWIASENGGTASEEEAPSKYRKPASELSTIYTKARMLAQNRLDLEFKPSQTIREAAATVEAKEGNTKSAFAFSNLSLIFEEWLYKEKSDPARVPEALELYLNLSKYWQSKEIESD